MKKLLFQSGVLLLLLALTSTGHAGAGHTHVKFVFCDKGHSIQKAVDRARDGRSIRVFGTCHEAVFINKDRITIFTNDGATVIPPAGSTAFAVGFADNVVIAGFNIWGGREASQLLMGRVAAS